MNPKVCILTAGIGRRLNSHAKILNKALLPLEGKAIISHIIEKFSLETEFVIAIGYKSEQVVNYLRLAHSDRSFIFVKVENFDGIGSGPGLSALYCQAHLMEAFYLVSSDTLWTEDINLFPISHNWIGVSQVTVDESENYCNILIKNELAEDIFDKTRTTEKNTMAFTGLAFIKTPDFFWQGLLKEEQTLNEKQISTGLREIIEKDLLKVKKITWTDVGTEQKYIDEVKKHSNFPHFTK